MTIRGAIRNSVEALTQPSFPTPPPSLTLPVLNEATPQPLPQPTALFLPSHILASLLSPTPTEAGKDRIMRNRIMKNPESKFDKFLTTL
jgi:hypothetical protein